MTQTVTVTGSRGFIGSHLAEAVARRPDTAVIGIDVDDSTEALQDALARSQVVFHIAGVNRPEKAEDYEAGNAGFTLAICEHLAGLNHRPLVVYSSSTQADLNNEYGQSKRRSEEILSRWSEATGSAVALFRLPNVFGKWARPNYNSAVATFCHNAAHNLPLTVSDPSREMHLVYIDDVVESMIQAIDEPPSGCEFRTTGPVFRIRLGELASRILSFSETRGSVHIPDFSDGLTRRLYATFLSHLDERDLAYELDRKSDSRGSLAEVLKAPCFGQVCISRTAPGVTRGNHYHHTKCEKFMVVEGEAVVRLRDIRGGSVLEYAVSGNEFIVIDIPPGYTHSIENVGEGDMVTLFWVDELFEPASPDTYFLPVAVEKGTGVSA